MKFRAYLYTAFASGVLTLSSGCDRRQPVAEAPALVTPLPEPATTGTKHLTEDASSNEREARIELPNDFRHELDASLNAVRSSAAAGDQQQTVLFMEQIVADLQGWAPTLSRRDQPLVKTLTAELEALLNEARTSTPDGPALDGIATRFLEKVESAV